MPRLIYETTASMNIPAPPVINPDDPRYGGTAMAFHWTVAACILAAVALALSLEIIPEGPTNDAVFAIHKSVGLVILLLTLARALWRFTHPAPALPPLPAWQRHSSQAVHLLLYVMAIIMPVSGYIAVAARGRETVFLGLMAVPRWVPLDRRLAHQAETVHVVSQYVLYGLLAAHVGAALYHHFVVHDGVLRRMWPARPKDAPAS